MSRQLFEQCVALERAVDALTKRVEVLELKADNPMIVVNSVAELPGQLPKRGPGRPPKVHPPLDG